MLAVYETPTTRRATFIGLLSLVFNVFKVYQVNNIYIFMSNENVSVGQQKVSQQHKSTLVACNAMRLYQLSPTPVLVPQVMHTRSTSGMYLPLSIAITAAACLWATYGILTWDFFVVAPQSVGFLAGIAQLLLFVRSVLRYLPACRSRLFLYVIA